jgi:hypothetical protein
VESIVQIRGPAIAQNAAAASLKSFEGLLLLAVPTIALTALGTPRKGVIPSTLISHPGRRGWD